MGGKGPRRRKRAGKGGELFSLGKRRVQKCPELLPTGGTKESRGPGRSLAPGRKGEENCLHILNKVGKELASTAEGGTVDPGL